MQQDTDRDAAYLADLLTWVYDMHGYESPVTADNLRTLWFEGLDDMGHPAKALRQPPYLGLYGRDNDAGTAYAVKTSGAAVCPNLHAAQPLPLDQLFKFLMSATCY